jgi:hypothetical protein
VPTGSRHCAGHAGSGSRAQMPTFSGPSPGEVQLPPQQVEVDSLLGSQ